MLALTGSWKSHGNEKYNSRPVHGNGKERVNGLMGNWEWDGIKTLHFPFLTESKLTSLTTTGIAEM